MTTLNARANQAYHEAAERLDGFGFDNQRDAFEDGWETGYKAAEGDINATLEAEPASRWPGYGECNAQGKLFGPCVFVAGHHEVESWTPHADMFGRTWNDQPAEEPS